MSLNSLPPGLAPLEPTLGKIRSGLNLTRRETLHSQCLSPRLNPEHVYRVGWNFDAQP